MAKEEKEKKTKRKMAGEIASREPTVQDEVEKGSKKRKKTQGKVPGGGSDRISELPNDILRAILSFLPLHCAVRTSILSRRWRHVWDPASVSSLDLDRSGFKRHRGFVEFVEKALSLSRETSQDVPRFFLSLPRAVPDPRWLQHALTHNVRVLELEVFSLGSSIVSNIFSCRSLEVLVLSFSDHWSELTPDDKDPVDLARLRTLRFTNGTFYSRFTERLDSHCPALKDLHFSRCHISHLKISSPSLERLSLQQNHMSYSSPDVFEVEAPNLRCLLLDFRNRCSLPVIRVSLPSLVRFEYHGSKRLKEFSSDFPVISEVFINMPKRPEVARDVVRILQHLYNVSNLTLSRTAFQSLCTEADQKHLPTFFNLKHLKILSNTMLNKKFITVISKVMKDLFPHSPNLQSLKIENEDVVSSGYHSNECVHHLKRDQIEGSGELYLAELLLETARSSECITIRFDKS